MKNNNSTLKIILFFLIISFGFLGFTKNSLAATIQANSCSQEDVQNIINLAVSGDIVFIPEGNCTWSTAVIIPSTKKIILQGAGIDKTEIIFSSTGGNVIDSGQSGSRITGFTFVIPSTSSVSSIIHVYGEGWRIDHCKFVNQTTYDVAAVLPRGTSSFPDPKGLIDNCIFYNCRVVVYGNAALLAHSSWVKPLGLGTDDAVYIEDCFFTKTIFGHAIDANYGGSYVFRYNVVNDEYLETHSLQGNHRATRKWEIYGNTINQINRSIWTPIFMRGGTGVIFNNTITGTWSSGPSIIFDNVRSFRNFDFPPGICNGTSSWDGNQDSTGWPCRDQIGRSTDQWLWTSDNPYPPQVSEPAYIWNNRYQEKEVRVSIHNCSGGSTSQGSCAHIKAGRDYIEGVPKPGYVPFTYPHPFRTDCTNYPMLCDTDTTPPAAPSNLMVQ